MATVVGSRSGLFWKKVPGGIAAIVNAGAFSGNVFFVDSVASGATDVAGYGTTPDAPFKTIDFAVGQCTANQGDVIFVLPGHVETVAAAAGLDLDVAGIRIIGLGNRADRPKIDFTATGADMDIDAANITLENFNLDLTSFDALAAPIDVNSAGFTMRKCHVLTADSGGQCTLGVLTDANADYMVIEDCFFEGSSDAGTTATVRIVGGDFIEIKRCRFVGAYTTTIGAIEMLTTAPSHILIDDCDINNTTAASTVCITGITGATGTIRRCTLRNQTDANNGQIAATGNMQLFENYGVNNNGERGIALGTASV